MAKGAGPTPLRGMYADGISATIIMGNGGEGRSTNNAQGFWVEGNRICVMIYPAKRMALH